MAWPEPLRPRPHTPTPVWLVTTDDQCAQATEQPHLRTEWVIVQVGEGQPRPRGLPRSTTLLVALEVPHDPHMAVHTLEHQPDDVGHLVVHQRGGLAWLREHRTALRSWASMIAGAEIRLHDHPAIRPDDTRALKVDQLTPSNPNVSWHSAALNAGWLSPTGYYWIPEAWGHMSSDASGGGPCRHATSIALAADLTRTWAVAISGTVLDGEGVAGSLPLQYGIHRPCVYKVDTEVFLPSSAARGSRAGHGGPCGRGKGGQPDATAMASGQPARARARHQTPILVCPGHLPQRRRATAQGGLGAVQGHCLAEHAAGSQPRPAHHRR